MCFSQEASLLHSKQTAGVACLRNGYLSIPGDGQYGLEPRASASTENAERLVGSVTIRGTPNLRLLMGS